LLYRRVGSAQVPATERHDLVDTQGVARSRLNPEGGMSEDTYLAQAERWRKKAEELRAVADQMRNPFSRQSFLRMAETYDRLAEEYENKAANQATSKPDVG
jgi:hypothetical protein